MHRTRKMASGNAKVGSHTAHIKSCYLNTREYDEAHMHKRFTEISDAMHSRTEKELGFEPSDVTARSLSLLTGNLRAFVESTLGKDADPASRSITKFPPKLFTDYRPDGALYNMLCVCLNFKYLHGLRRFEFSNMDKRGFNFDLLTRMERSLKQARVLPMVKVYFARSLPTAVQPPLRAIVQKRGAIVSSASAATHIVYPDPPGTTMAETSGTDYCRPLELKEDIALVHWWYYPDSYDSWIPRADVDGEPDPPDDTKGPWHVQMRWLEDTELYNEWMNPADYEISPENRMQIIPAPRIESAEASSVKEETKIEPPNQENTVKVSKKRKRVSSVNPRPSAEGGSVRDPAAVSSGEGLSAELIGDEKVGEKNRTSHKKGGASSRERERKPKSESRALSKESEDLHQRKKPRTSEEGKRGTQNVNPQQSVKVRLSLKAPKDRAKHRQKDKKKEGKVPEGPPRDASADSRSGLKVKVKLGKQGRASVSNVVKSEEKAKANDDDDATSTQARATGAAASHDSDGIDKTLKARKEKTAVKSENDSARRDTKKNFTGILEKSTAERETPDNDSVAQEQKRPFSRRRRRETERNMRLVSQYSGVEVVEEAVPLAEGEVPRIRNISNHGVDRTDAKSRSSGRDEAEMSDSMQVEDGRTEESDRAKADVKAPNGDMAMDVDTGANNRRTMAISERMLDEDVANAPASGADLMDSIPDRIVRMPAHSRWFRMDAIHDIEKRVLSEFFNNRSQSKTPLVYKKYRDFMIDVWRQAPEKYLTATSVRRHLAGDVCAILRVHTFLEHWGLINYGAEPESKPYLGSASRTRYSRPRPLQLDERAKDHWHGVPRLLFFDEPKPQKREGSPQSLSKAVKAAKESNGQHKVPSLLSRRELYATAAATKYECDGCGSDCSRMRYHCVGAVDIELCPSCFADGNYPETLSARDFEQLTTVLGSEAHDGSVWSEAEVLLLLEGLEKYGDDWNQVSDHVGTKSSEQCVLQFLRMPIEDSFLSDQLGKWDPVEGLSHDADVVQEGKHDPTKLFAGPLLPFADTANPVMAQVAFLASSVSPEVAAAASQAALHALMSDTSSQTTVHAEDRGTQAKALLHSAGSISRMNGTAPNSIQDNSKLGSLPGTKLDAVAVEAAASVGLAAAVAKARNVAEMECREIERSFAIVVETKLRIVDMKLQEFDRLEQHLRRERDRLEKHRQSVYSDRVEAALMRRGGEIEASRVAAAHQAAVSVAAGMPVPHLHTGQTATAQVARAPTPAANVQTAIAPMPMASPDKGGQVAMQIDGVPK